MTWSLLPILFLYAYVKIAQASRATNHAETSWCLGQFGPFRWTLVRRHSIDPRPTWVRHHTTQWLLVGWLVECIGAPEMRRVCHSFGARWDYLSGGYYQIVDHAQPTTWTLVLERLTRESCAAR